MLAPVTLGAIIGIVAFLPLAFSIKLSKKVTPTSNLSYTSVCLLCVLVSIVVLGVSVIVCCLCFKEALLPFAISCAITLVLVALIFGIYINVSRKKFADQRNAGSQEAEVK